ncbi:hypothetical protein SteCoe_8645 [Stentor coeruleus]|uniref:F-box domain-containing protein n=1 Tax=Stentor coeruleus TaxID=5963 RepID=A0A1R2CJS8_9CILI|nr:hypothetical protein SteCoe_8645 [Stentor coeruleus]
MSLNKSNPSLQTIKKELLLIILSYLDNKMYFTIIPTISKYFKAATYNLLKYKKFVKLKIDPNTIKPISKILEIISLSHSLENLELNFTSEIPSSSNEFTEIKSLFSSFPLKLSVLSLSVSNFVLSEKLLSNFSNIKTIKIYSESVLNIDQALLNLLNNNRSVDELLISVYELKDFKIFNKLAQCIQKYDNLKKFTLKARNREKIIECWANTDFFTSSSNLIELKLDEKFIFSEEQCELFYSAVASNKTLRYLSISESIVRRLDQFLELIEENKTLQTLKLKHLYVDMHTRRIFKIKVLDTIRIFEKIGNSCITSFSITTFYAMGTWFYYNNYSDYNEGLDINTPLSNEDDYIFALSELLDKRKFSKISVNFIKMREEYRNMCFEMLINHAMREDYVYFNGCIVKEAYKQYRQGINYRKDLKLFTENSPQIKFEFYSSYLDALDNYNDQVSR